MGLQMVNTLVHIVVVLGLWERVPPRILAAKHSSNGHREFGTRNKGEGSMLPSYLPTSLLPDQGKTESKLPEPLLQTAMTYYQTLPEDVDAAKLIKILGSHFDPKWMSIDRPYEAVQQVEVFPGQPFVPELLTDMRTLNFTYVDEHRNLIAIEPHVQHVMEQWLLQKASCPVRYQWEDVGPFFWPRWIKKGSCDSGSKCSWPTGMMCVPSPRPMTVRILRWHCRPRRRKVQPAARVPRAIGYRNRKTQKRKSQRDKQYRIKCRWRKVRYPITTKCFCTC